MSERSPSGPSAQATFRAVALCVVLGGALRVAAAQGDLWLDEIVSLLAARELDSPLGVFTIASDNNHHLNTLWLWVVGELGGSFAPRLLAIVSGTAAIALAAGSFESRRPWARIVAAVLVATSFPLVTYGSEARGYAPMVCWGIAALVLLRRALSERGPGAALAFGCVSVLGFLSHLSFAMFYAALAAWSVGVVSKQRLGGARGARALLRLHGLPLVFLPVFYAVSLRDTTILGAPPQSASVALAEVAALTLGIPVAAELAFAAVLAAVVLLGIALASERRAGSDLWVFHLFAIAVVPALLVLVRPPEFAYPRYFLAPLTAGLLLLASLLGRWIASGGASRWVAAGACAVIVVGNAVELARFLGPQRGAYRAAVTGMLEEAAAGPIRYGSDHPYRNGSLVDFHAAVIPGDHRFEYVDKPEWSSAGPPAWYLRHDFDRTPEADPFRLLQQRYLYRLVEHHPYHGLSGWHWFVYHYERELSPEAARRLIRER